MSVVGASVYALSVDAGIVALLLAIGGLCYVVLSIDATASGTNEAPDSGVE